MTRRQDIETRIPGVSMIQRILPSSSVTLASYTGADEGTGEVVLALKGTGVVPGQYNTFVVGEDGRIVKAWNETAGGGSGGGSYGAINNQSDAVQEASFWINGPARIDGNVSISALAVTNVSAQRLTLTQPLGATYGGTGASAANAGYVFAGPASGAPGTPTWRPININDIPSLPWTKLLNTPTTVDGYGIVDVYTRSEADTLFMQVGNNSNTTSAVTIAEWQPYKLYTDQVITYQLRLFKCTIVHTSGPSFDNRFWHEFISSSALSDHSQLNGLNSDPLAQHVTLNDINRWNGLQTQIDELKASLGSNTAKQIVIANDDTLNGSSNLDRHAVTRAKFLISGAQPADTVVLNDISKVTAVPSGIRGAVTVQQIAGAWYLVVNLVNITYGSNFSVTVGTGCVLVNSSSINSNAVTCSFSTAPTPSQPVIGQSTMNGRFGIDPATLTSVVFPVTVASGTLNLSLADSGAWSCSPVNIVVDRPVVDSVAHTITFTLAGAVSDTQYTISANAGLVANNSDVFNTGSVAASFSTQLSVPVLGTSPDDGRTDVDVTATGRYVSFPITTTSGRGNFDIADPSKITITGATPGGVSIVSGSLRIYYSGGNDGDVVVFGVAPGAVKNYTLGDSATNAAGASATIRYAIRAPAFSAPSLADNQDVSQITSTILVPYTSTAAVQVDATKITSTPAGIVTAAALTTSGSSTYLQLTLGTLTQNQAISITLGTGTIKNLGVTSNAAYTFGFRVAAAPPLIQQSPLNGTSVAAGSVTAVTFAVSGTDTLALVATNKVTITPAAGSGTATLSGGVLSLPVTLTTNTNYTVTVAAGAVKNRNTLNATQVVCNFATATVFSVGQSPTNGTRIPSSTTSITFPLSNINGTASIADAGKITGANCTVSNPTVSGNTLTVQISGLGFSANASVVIAPGALRDAILTNTNSVTCAFTTNGSIPTIGTGSLAGQTTVATSTAYLEFPVTASGTVTVANAAAVTSTPAGIVSSVSITGSIGTYKLRVSLGTLTQNTNYTVNVGSGVVSNDGTMNTGTGSCAFKTVEQAPVIGQSTANSTFVDAGSLTTVTFPITAASACILVAASKVTISGGPSISNVAINSSNLVVTLSGVAVNQTIAIAIAAGTLSNADGVLNTNTVSTTIRTKGDAPVIAQSPAHSSTSLAISPAYIEYAVTASGTPTIANANLVTVTPNHLQSVSMVSGKLRVAINLVNDTNYTVAIAAGLLVNNQTLSTTTLTTTFKTALPAPVVGQSTINGTTQATSLTAVDFPITNPGTLTVANAAKVTATNATISSVTVVGSALRVTISGLLNSRTVSIAVASGAVSNGDATNTNAVTCTFTTAGSTPTVGQSTVNGTTPPKTLATVDFPITGASGTLAVANAAKVYAPAGYDNIVSSVSISGSNLRVTLATLAFNKAYRLQVDAGAVSNDGVTNTNAVTCNFTTLAAVPVVGQSPVNGTRQAITAQTLSFPITASAVVGTYAVANASLITGTNCTVGTPSISGSNLLVPVSGLSNSKAVTVSIAAGAVSNSGVVTTAATICTFTTVGALVTIGQATQNGGAAVTAGAQNIDFPLSASSFGTLVVDSAKITSSPAAIASTPTVVNVSGTNYLRVPMTLAGTTSYTISIAAGAVTNDGTLTTNTVSCAFTTAAGAARPILYEYQFVLPNAIANFNLFAQADWGGRVLTLEDIYGPNYDGAGNVAEIKWYGYVGNLSHPEGVLVPRDGIDTFTATNPDWGYQWDDATGIISFLGGSPSNKVYRIIKYVS